MKRKTLKKVFFAMVTLFALIVAIVTVNSDNVVTNYVLQQTTKGLAEDLQHEYSHCKSEGILWSVGVYARHSTYKQQMDTLHQYLYDALQWGVEGRNLSPQDSLGRLTARTMYQDILKTMRTRLSNPENLKGTYMKRRFYTLFWIKFYGIEKEVKDEMEIVLKYFQHQDLDSTDRKLLRAYYCSNSPESLSCTRSEWLGMQSYQIRPKLRERGISGREIAYYQWAQRRGEEGGQEILDMYVWIIKDAIYWLDLISFF